MTQEENLCIYTKENDTEAHFRNQEHIIPACIGGMQKLPKGYVSDEVNTLFSALELKLARKFTNYTSSYVYRSGKTWKP